MKYLLFILLFAGCTKSTLTNPYHAKTFYDFMVALDSLHYPMAYARINKGVFIIPDLSIDSLEPYSAKELPVSALMTLRTIAREVEQYKGITDSVFLNQGYDSMHVYFRSRTGWDICAEPYADPDRSKECRWTFNWDKRAAEYDLFIRSWLGYQFYGQDIKKFRQFSAWQDQMFANTYLSALDDLSHCTNIK